MHLSHTLADGLAVAQVGALSFATLQGVVDEVVTVDEASIALAILRLIELEKSVVEGAGAAPLAAFLAGRLDSLKGSDVVLVLCGGNIDLTILDRVIEIGLVADGRLSRFTVSISDRPGGLARLAEIIASTGASIKEIVHDRAFSGPDLSEVRVVCIVETTGHEHVAQLHRALADAKVRIVAPSRRRNAARRNPSRALRAAGRRSFCQHTIAATPTRPTMSLAAPG